MADQTYTQDNTTYTLMENLPVFIGANHPEYSIAKDWASGVVEMRRVLDAQKEPLFWISDIRALKISLEDVVAAANMGGRGEEPIWHHPKIRGVYFVSNSKMVELAARGMNTPMFGNTVVKVFSTVEKALEDIEQVLASEG
jgi:hypothetical protein